MVLSVETQSITAFDGARLAVHEAGDVDGRPLLLLHGLASSAEVNWIKYGTAKRLVDAGFRCIMPDIRGHGASEPGDLAADWPPDILVRDAGSVIAALGLREYDLCGFSLGARTAARLVIEGAAPRRLVIAGMGYEGLADWASRRDHFLDIVARMDVLQRGDPGFLAAAFIRTTGIDPTVVAKIVRSFGDLDPAGFAAIAMPTLVLAGEDDRDNGSPDRLADALPHGRTGTVPGNHMSCVTKPAFGDAIREFLTAQ